jgi:hypothetical protein
MKTVGHFKVYMCRVYEMHLDDNKYNKITE